MAKQLINLGATANDGSGDPLRVAGEKINANMNELYDALGDGDTLNLTSDLVIEGSSNLYFSTERAQDAVGLAINAGIQTAISVTYDDANNRINFNVADAVTTGIQTGLSVTYDSVTNKINFNNDISGPYSFTTRGFSIPI